MKAIVPSVFMKVLNLDQQQADNVVMACVSSAVKCSPAVSFKVRVHSSTTFQQRPDDPDIGLATRSAQGCPDVDRLLATYEIHVCAPIDGR